MDILSIKIKKKSYIILHYFFFAILSMIAVHASEKQTSHNKKQKIIDSRTKLSKNTILRAQDDIHEDIALTIQMVLARKLHLNPLVADLFQKHLQPFLFEKKTVNQHLLQGNTDNKIHNNFSPIDEITQIRFSQDQKQIASTSRNKKIQIWNSTIGKIMHTLERQTDSECDIYFFPYGSQLMSASTDNLIQSWNTSTGNLIKTSHITPDNKLFNIQFSPTGTQLISLSQRNDVQFWNSTTGKLNLTLQNTHGINNVYFSNDETALATTSDSTTADETIQLWNTTTGAQTHILQGHTKPVAHVCFSADKTQLASVSDDNTARLWNTANGQLLHTLREHTGKILHSCFSPDGQQLASASNDTSIRLWNTVNGELTHTLNGHINTVHHVTFSPDGKQLASAAYDNTIRIWNPTTGDLAHILTGHQNLITHAIFSPNGQQIASTSWDHTVRLWKNKEIFILESQSETTAMKNYIQKKLIALNTQRETLDTLISARDQNCTNRYNQVIDKIMNYETNISQLQDEEKKEQ